MEDEQRPFGLHIEQREGYLYAHVKALEVSPTDFADLLNDLSELCAPPACDKILLYREVPSMSGVGNTFDIVSAMLRLLPGLMVAVVNPYKGNTDLLNFAATVAQTRGYKLQIFPDEPSALEWLGLN